MLQTPVLLVVFNRPDTTQRVFDAIREQKPKYLYVAADGPRKNKPGEAEVCQQVRDIIKQVDWDCEVKTLFHEQNLGCKMAEASAFTWFFENVEQGIILEDDTLPNPTFFRYCEELLEKYKDDTRIGHISGNNFLPDVIEKGLSYDYGSRPYAWGWAGWRRAWRNYDVDFPFWETQKNKRSILFHNKREKIYYSSFIPDTIYNRNGINTWDTQWIFALRLQNQLCIYPSINLVENIGAGHPEAVHMTKKSKQPSAGIMSFPLTSPLYVLRNKRLDDRSIPFSWKRLVRYILKMY